MSQILLGQQEVLRMFLGSVEPVAIWLGSQRLWPADDPDPGYRLLTEDGYGLKGPISTDPDKDNQYIIQIDHK